VRIIVSNTVLAILPLMVPSSMSRSSPAAVPGHRRLLDGAVVVPRQLAQQLDITQLENELRLGKLAHRRLVIFGQRTALGQQRRVVGGQPVGGHEALTARARRSGSAARICSIHVASSFSARGRARGIPVIVRVLFGTHRARVAVVRVPEPGFLDDPLASVERVCLAPHLVLESALHVAERVHVLDLDLGAELGRPRASARGWRRTAAEPSSMLPSHTPR